MFITLAVEDTREPLRLRIERRLKGETLEWQEKTCCGNRYRHVVWHGPAQRLPWMRLSMLCPRPRTPVLLPPGLLPPPEVPLRDYQPQDFYARLTVAATRQYLLSRPPSGRGLVGLIDPQGIAPWACAELADCCRGLKVLTLRRSRYALQETALREEQGLPLLWAETTAELAECTLCVAPYPTGVLTVRRPVLTADRSAIQGRPTVNRLALTLSEEQQAMVPQGVEPTAFWGMVTECGQRRVSLPMTVCRCRIDGRLADFSELARVIET